MGLAWGAGRPCGTGLAAGQRHRTAPGRKGGGAGAAFASKYRPAATPAPPDSSAGSSRDCTQAARTRGEIATTGRAPSSGTSSGTYSDTCSRSAPRTGSGSSTRTSAHPCTRTNSCACSGDSCCARTQACAERDGGALKPCGAASRIACTRGQCPTRAQAGCKYCRHATQCRGATACAPRSCTGCECSARACRTPKPDHR